MSEWQRAELSELIGKKLRSVTRTNDELHIATACGRQYRFSHHQDCCESVDLVEVVGDLEDLCVGQIVESEVVSSEGHPDPPGQEFFTWSFYKLRSWGGSVVLRWLGTSNGYYSERVDFERREDS